MHWSEQPRKNRRLRRNDSSVGQVSGDHPLNGCRASLTALDGECPASWPCTYGWPNLKLVRAALAQSEDLAVPSELAEWEILAAINGFDRRPADVGEH